MANPIMALIQMEILEEKNRNLEKAQIMIEKASEQGANIVVLPEMFNCPYISSVFPIYAEKSGDISWEILSKCAREANVYLVGGSIPEWEDGKVYNTCYMFSPQGDEIAKHRKMHLFDIDVLGGQQFKESETLSPGNKITLVDTHFCKIGIGICYDIRFSEFSRILALNGAKIIIFPAAFNMTTGPVHWEMSFRMRALDNQVFVAGCSPARNVKANYVSYGHSIITSPWGESIHALKEKEGILIQEIELNKIDRVRKELPLLEHRREDIYAFTDKTRNDL
ncbi:MAG: carbon-nitrogen hydrolase family protein [Eubacteriales bacterium]